MTNIAQHTVNLLTNIIDSADKMTIGQMVDEAYLCLLDTSWDLPVRKYTRKAQVIADLQHVISRIGACPVYAERVPDVTPEKRPVQLLDMAKAIDANMGWLHLTDTFQYARSKPNRLPRGKCARRMLSIGWVFNH